MVCPMRFRTYLLANAEVSNHGFCSAFDETVACAANCDSMMHQLQKPCLPLQLDELVHCSRLALRVAEH